MKEVEFPDDPPPDNELWWCLNCKRYVQPPPRVNTLAVIVLMFLLIIPGVIYLAVALSRNRHCPICRSTALISPNDLQRDRYVSENPHEFKHNEHEHTNNEYEPRQTQDRTPTRKKSWYDDKKVVACVVVIVVGSIMLLGLAGPISHSMLSPEEKARIAEEREAARIAAELQREADLKEIRNTPLTHRQTLQLGDDRRTCALYAYTSQTALYDCLEDADEREMEFREQNWLEAKNP